MARFEVPDMSCGHCRKAVEAAIHAADPAATITCDLKTQVVDVQSTADPASIAAAIVEAGYAPALLT